MPQSLSKVYTHIIFSTKHRVKLIDKQIEPHLYNYLGGICKNFECNPVQIGGHKNHVHLLCLLSRKISQMKLVQELKQNSSKWIKSKGEKYKDFYWQEGYGIFSVSPKNVDKVSDYIRDQESHHKHLSFKDEFRMFLDKYGMDYDERYVWD
ncbi:MAG: IS200/IS605 family transposase [Balneolaceae bacterium]|nr:IS200/IS605 family transposase [Balneolaceae bacterium]